MKRSRYSVHDVLSDKEFAPISASDTNLWIMADAPNGGMLFQSERGYILPPEDAAVLIAQLQLGYARVDADQVALVNAEHALVEGAYDYAVEQRSRR